jgi:hypothetical protein
MFAYKTNPQELSVIFNFSSLFFLFSNKAGNAHLLFCILQHMRFVISNAIKSN